MDFDFASKRLQREHEQQRRMNNNNKKQNFKSPTAMMTNNNNNNKSILKYQNEIKLHQQRQEQRQKEREQQLFETTLLRKYLQKWDEQLHIQSLLSFVPLGGSPNVVHISKNHHDQKTQQQHLQLQATSIYGDGDKITLPPSILERLLELQENNTNRSNNNQQQQQQQQPWTFRIGVRHPTSFINPVSTQLLSAIQQHASSSITAAAAAAAADGNDDEDDEEENDDDHDDDDNDDMVIDDDDNVASTTSHSSSTTAISHRMKQRQQRHRFFMNDATFYLHELQQFRYLSYTHGTVMEFTQDEGYIGIPKSIANALLNHNNNDNSSNSNNDNNNEHSRVEVTRTHDPSVTTTSIIQSTANIDRVNESITKTDVLSPIVADHAMMVNDDIDMSDNNNKTPGHIAYGAFDIPAMPIEIVLLQLPMGTGMTLRPITTSFYQLQQDQIKYALELSIQRTRATITVNDSLITWYRGQEYIFIVTHLIPSTTYNAISCINTDIEIEFEPMDSISNNNNDGTDQNTPSSLIDSNHAVAAATTKTSLGRRLIDEPAIATTNIHNPERQHYSRSETSLLPEPPMEEKDNIITIQFRFSSITGSIPIQTVQRRFNIVTSTIQDVFQFVHEAMSSSSSSATTGNSSNNNVQLIRRYPRRVFTNNNINHDNRNNDNNNLTLQQSGFQTGNELLIVEEIAIPLL